ncbi:MAG: hypothetical protein ACE5J3_08140 [Methanosarcinales archaeon]
MKSQTILLAIAAVAIGVFAMPSTVSLFTGQHTFYNGSSVKCEKCHMDIYEEFKKIVDSGGSTAHASAKWTGGTAGQKFFECTECHRVDINISYYYQKGLTSGEKPKAHAAQTVPCLACHKGELKESGMHKLRNKYGMAKGGTGCDNCHYHPKGPRQGDPKVAKIEKIDEEITGTDAVHTPYYYQSLYPDNQTNITLKDANTACIGCHTHTTINMTWKRNIGYDMIINHISGPYNITFVKNNTMTTTYSGGE